MLLSKLPYAFRSLYRHKLYTLLNVSGLAIGLAVSLLVALYLQAEFTYDKHWEDHDRIYRVNAEFHLGNNVDVYGGTGYGAASLLQDYYAEIEQATHLLHIENSIYFKSDSLRDYVEDVVIADSNFFKVFRLNFLQGNSNQALSEPRSIVLSESFALQYFGSLDIVGKYISTSNFEYKIAGVVEDLPENSHHYFKALISEPHIPRDSSDLSLTLWQVGFYTFVKLKEGVEESFIEAKFDGFFDRYMEPLADAVQGRYYIDLQPISKLHFYSNKSYDRPGGRLVYVYGFAGIGLLILILAIINYINMATARSLRRIREAAMRKVLGADGLEIRLMILVESVLVSLLALLLAFAMVEVATQILPFNSAIGKSLSLNLSANPFLVLFSLGLAILVGVLSGLYPAINLAKVSPLDAFSNKKGLQRGDYLPRKVLVAFQVSVSVAVVITAFFMYRQMEFIKNRNLGFNADQVVLVSIQDTSSIQKIDQITRAFRRSAYVESVSLGASVTGSGTYRSLFEVEQEGLSEYRRESLNYLAVGPDYLKTMEIPLLLGRAFDEQDLEDSLEERLIVNQAMVDFMQWKNPLGKRIRRGFDEEGQAQISGRVIGVCGNFNAQSLHAQMAPLVLTLNRETARVIHLKIDRQQVYVALDDIERRWTSLVPQVPFQFSFLRKDLLEMYQEELRQSKLILYLTIVAIIISILGFVGLASFTTGLRTREIAIRNVLGAGSWDLVNLIFKELLWVILIGVLIAVPLAVVLTRWWLLNFAFRTNIEPSVIVLTVIITLIIGYGIVALHSFTVARRNSIHSLENLR